jgi:hypothetical protein
MQQSEVSKVEIEMIENYHGESEALKIAYDTTIVKLMKMSYHL